MTQTIKDGFSRVNAFFIAAAILLLVGSFVTLASERAHAATESGSVGLTGTISAPPPTQGATISIPRNGQAFTEVPVTISGLCPDGLLVKIFKNNVFAGSVQCQNGSFSLVTDLFNGANELVARVYDALDQPGPDSNIVSVTYGDNRQGAGSKVSLSSNYAKRGANPKDTLTWPIILSGGEGPYAVSVDWGDGTPPDLKSIAFPGTFNIDHVFDSPGVYNVIIKATDKNGGTAYLQVVAVANGPLTQDNAGGKTSADQPSVETPKVRIVWQPAAILVPFLISTFWLGKKYELRMLRKKIERGIHPFQ